MSFLRTLIVIVAIWLVIRIALKLYRARQQEAARTNRPQAPDSITAMVACATCGVHVPKTEALPAGGRYFCSDDHRNHHEQRRNSGS